MTITTQVQFFDESNTESDSLAVSMSYGSDTMQLGRGRIREENLRYHVGGDSVVMRMWYPVGVPVDTARLVVLVPPYNTPTFFLFPLALATTRRGLPTAMLPMRGPGGFNSHLDQSYGLRESADLVAALDAYSRRHNLPALRVGLFGASLGSAVALDVAAGDTRVVAVAVEGLLDSIETAARRLMSEEEFARLSAHLAGERERVAQLSPRHTLSTMRPLPLMVRWGSRENLVTAEEQEQLTRIIRERFADADVRIVEGGMHILRYGFPLSEAEAREVNEEIARFLEQHLQR